MMPTFETRTTRVSLYGRFADALTRRSVAPSAFQTALGENGAKPIYKEDGSFVFINLEPEATPYSITVQGRVYRTREISANLPAIDAVSLARDGEDELYVSITAVDAAQNRVELNSIPFLRTIGAGAAVTGEGGFSATLQEPLEGENVDFAELSTVGSLALGNVLRIVRSDRLLLRPGPYYTFSEPAIVLSARFVENTPAAEPVAGAQMVLNQVNGVATTTVNVGAVVLHRVQLAGESVILGPASAIETRSNLRGEALLDFPAHLSITSLRLQVSHPRYAPVSQTVAVTAGEVTRWAPPLSPV